MDARNDLYETAQKKLRKMESLYTLASLGKEVEKLETEIRKIQKLCLENNLK